MALEPTFSTLLVTQEARGGRRQRQRPSFRAGAIAEFDRLGREEFLRRYAFRESRRYFLSHEGGLYDSKAILGAAHGLEHPDKGPLTWQAFNGGSETTRRLKALGFKIEELGTTDAE